jgi:hypothetical protein
MMPEPTCGVPNRFRMRAPNNDWLAMKRPAASCVSRSGMRSSLLLAPTKSCSINLHAVENRGDLAPPPPWRASWRQLDPIA